MNNEEQFISKVQDIATYKKYGKVILDAEKKAANGPVVRNCVQHYASKVVFEIKNFLAELCTGFGKSRIAFMVIDELTQQDANATFLIVHDQVNHKKNLIEDFNKFYGDITKYNVTFVTYRSVHKYADQQFTALILDEAHHITDTNQPYLTSIKAEYRLYLSATVPPEKRRLLLKLDKSKMHVLKISIKQAEQWGVLPKTEYLIIPVYADHKERKYSYHYRKTKKGEKVQHVSFMTFNAMPYKPKDTIITCTEAEYIQLLDGEILYWISLADTLKKKGSDVQWIWNTRVKPLGARRKAFYAEIKGHFVHKHLSTLVDDFRTIIFAERIEQVETFGIPAVHSKQKDAVNQQIVEDFNSFKIDAAGAVNMFNESMNLKGMQLSIILQLATNSKVINVQRQGRSVRGKRPVIILPYVFGTKDEKVCMQYMEEYTTTKFDEPQQLIEHVRTVFAD